ncbi:hypothetical protein D0C16_23075 [Cellvibrio sp. KY-GH-1]|nr:hypothetical protein D0C16_23075 [Cellvibrio sp. KY-GH-1]
MRSCQEVLSLVFLEIAPNKRRRTNTVKQNLCSGKIFPSKNTGIKTPKKISEIKLISSTQ